MRGSVCRPYLIINHRCEREQEWVLKESLERDKTNIKATLKVFFLTKREREGNRETERSSAMNILVILCLRHFDRRKKKKKKLHRDLKLKAQKNNNSRPQRVKLK